LGVAWSTIAVLLVGLLAAATCKNTSNPPEHDAGTAGTGGCPSDPEALFTLHVRARDGQVPPDTELRITWSAQAEEPFELDDPETWPSVDDGANFECAVAPDASLPVELEELTCELWTNGATQVVASAAGYVTVDQTFTPAEREGCEGWVHSDVELELVRDLDAGR
jgi:hypothetical protein